MKKSFLKLSLVSLILVFALNACKNDKDINDVYNNSKKTKTTIRKRPYCLLSAVNGLAKTERPLSTLKHRMPIV